MSIKRYETMSWQGKIILVFLDALCAFYLLFHRAKKMSAQFSLPRKILLANRGHLGDVIIATSILPLIKAANPACEIGFLAGSWARPILERHPLIDQIYYDDHWYVNRSKQSLYKKIVHYFRSRRAVLNALCEAHYDVAIDLYAYFPNAAALLFQAHIPRRVGYTRGGCGALFTDPQPWILKDQHVVDYHIALLNVVFPEIQHIANLKPVLPRNITIDLHRFLPDHFLQRGFIVLHPGCGNTIKEWPMAQWKMLVKKMIDHAIHFVLTGQGEHESTLISQIQVESPLCINLCNRLTFPELVEVIATARYFVGVDSMAGHIASAVDTAGAIIGNGMSAPFHWKPLSQKIDYLIQPTSCAPCYHIQGCASMTCVRDVSVDAVFQKITENLL
ncbi:MAG: hypothetical protein A2X77_01790 [Gammaproteobacteria bacterium GWE2_42_36]|nr:MAG: hypothetical protein A2X77_01790 [Gammaproteobacteria bacterium GWE2_42_36]HCU05149.1 hypothetical protein [Coxiellaceae bacterium]